MTTAGALVQMPSHSGGAASLNGDEHSEVEPGKPGRRVIGETVRRGGYDIGQLQERPIHLLTVFRVGKCAEVQGIQRAGCCFDVTFRQMQITAGGLQIAVAEQ